MDWFEETWLDAQRAEKPKNDLKRRKEQKQPQLTGNEGKDRWK